MYTGLRGSFCVDGVFIGGVVASENCFIRRDVGHDGEPVCYIRVKFDSHHDMNLYSSHFEELIKGGVIEFSTNVLRRGFIHLVEVKR